MTALNPIRVFFEPVVTGAQRASRKTEVLPDLHEVRRSDLPSIIVSFVLHVMIGTFLFVVLALPGIALDIAVETFAMPRLAAFACKAGAYAMIASDIVLFLVFMVRGLTRVWRAAE